MNSCVLTGSHMNQCDFSGSELSDINSEGVEFINCRFDHVNFQRSDLKDVYLNLPVFKCLILLNQF